ncbi:MAG: ubiquinone/menaquinone biosynthesis protein [Chloroflexi bacterium]|nr:ubiquinone/menaquinone biosynthesis protein [Chloroflexota bacterium]
MPLPEPPSTDDRRIWDLWLSQWQLPAVLAAESLGIFRRLALGPAELDEMCKLAQLPQPAGEALMAAMCAMGYAAKRQGQFRITDLSRMYMLEGGEFYWLNMLRGNQDAGSKGDALIEALRLDKRAADSRTSQRWEFGRMTPEDAARMNRGMQSHSFPSALGVARHGDFRGVRRLLDVAGGSGCYAMAITAAHPELDATVADLPPVTADTKEYIRRYGFEDRVDTHSFNMFFDPWPSGYDAIFFSNVFHDWDAERCRDLARLAFAALPPGGRIYLHEMLLNDEHDGPLTAALFSLLMCLGTRGKQFSAGDLQMLLGEAGFGPIVITETYGYYSLVSATKPA